MPPQKFDHLPRFHVPFCLSHNLIYLLYFCPSLDISEINKQGCGLARKEHGNAVNDDFYFETRNHRTEMVE